MNVKNNKRRRKSREAIENVFIELIEEKELHHITVSDICQKADINRSTFYSNYVDIFDLASTICESVNSELSRKFGEEASLRYLTDNTADFFTFVQENQKLFRTVFKLNYDKTVEPSYYNTLLAERYFGNKYIDYHIEFFRNGFNAILRKWVFGGCKESPAEMAEILKSEYSGR